MFKRRALVFTGTLEAAPPFLAFPLKEKEGGSGRRRKGPGKHKAKKEVLNKMEEVGEGGESSLPWQPGENKVAICTPRVPPEGPFPRRTHHPLLYVASLSGRRRAFRAGPAFSGSRQKAISELHRKCVTLPEGSGKGCPGQSWPSGGAGGGGLSVTRSPA